jgi:hypothetical protein
MNRPINQENTSRRVSGRSSEIRCHVAVCVPLAGPVVERALAQPVVGTILLEYGP